MMFHSLRTHARSARLMLLVAVLFVAACGQEAPPRAEHADPTPAPYATRTPAPVTLPTAVVDASTPAIAEHDSPTGGPQVLVRALGDPNAPITVIEYSDYQ